MTKKQIIKVLTIIIIIIQIMDKNGMNGKKTDTIITTTMKKIHLLDFSVQIKDIIKTKRHMLTNAIMKIILATTTIITAILIIKIRLLIMKTVKK